MKAEAREREANICAQQDAYLFQMWQEHKAHIEEMENEHCANNRAASELQWSIEQAQRAAERSYAEQQQSLQNTLNAHTGNAGMTEPILSTPPGIPIKVEPVSAVIPPVKLEGKDMKLGKSSVINTVPVIHNGPVDLIVCDSYIGQAFESLDQFEKKT
ncbi:hypothetical protein C8J56DRAFT_1043006 [Mycena floridula]|nr:hypothetical protein C8J56DRAFT_1043006 [Mycena floridula]